MFGSFVETALESLFRKVLREDLNSDDRGKIFGYDGSIGTFSSKIVVAYGLKLIGTTSRRDLDLIRVLRNEFAHSRMPFNLGRLRFGLFATSLRLWILVARLSRTAT